MKRRFKQRWMVVVKDADGKAIKFEHFGDEDAAIARHDYLVALIELKGWTDQQSVQVLYQGKCLVLA